MDFVRLCLNSHVFVFNFVLVIFLHVKPRKILKDQMNKQSKFGVQKNGG